MCGRACDRSRPGATRGREEFRGRRRRLASRAGFDGWSVGPGPGGVSQSIGHGLRHRTLTSIVAAIALDAQGERFADRREFRSPL